MGGRPAPCRFFAENPPSRTESQDSVELSCLTDIAISATGGRDLGKRREGVSAGGAAAA